MASASTEERYNLAQLLRIPFQVLVAELHTRLAAAGYGDIHPPHSVIFAHLGTQGMRPTELAARAQMTKQMVGYLLDALEARGYVERVADSRDGRAKLVRLTSAGERAAVAGGAIIAAIEREWAERLGGEEMAALRAGLTALVAAMQPPTVS